MKRRILGRERCGKTAGLTLHDLPDGIGGRAGTRRAFPGPQNPGVFLLGKLPGSLPGWTPRTRGSGGSGDEIREERTPSSRIPNPEGEKARSGTRTTCSAFMDGLSWTDAKPIPERDDHRVDFRATRPVPPRGRDLCYFWFEAAPRALAITLGSSPTSSRSALRRRPEGSGS